MSTEQGFALHPLAAQDITDIWEYIAQDNPLAARRVREEILSTLRGLVPFPHQGRRRPTSPHGLCASLWYSNTSLPTRLAQGELLATVSAFLSVGFDQTYGQMRPPYRSCEKSTVRKALVAIRLTERLRLYRVAIRDTLERTERDREHKAQRA